MDAKQFKAESEILMDTTNIDFVTKKELVETWIEWTPGEGMDWLRDEDNHIYVHIGKEFYADDEVTPAILKKADYIEMSYAYGHAFYIGRNADPDALQDAFDASVGWFIENGIEFGELERTEDGKVVKVA